MPAPIEDDWINAVPSSQSVNVSTLTSRRPASTHHMHVTVTSRRAACTKRDRRLAFNHPLGASLAHAVPCLSISIGVHVSYVFPCTIVIGPNIHITFLLQYCYPQRPRKVVAFTMISRKANSTYIIGLGHQYPQYSVTRDEFADLIGRLYPEIITTPT